MLLFCVVFDFDVLMGFFVGGCFFKLLVWNIGFLVF